MAREFASRLKASAAARALHEKPANVSPEGRDVRRRMQVGSTNGWCATVAAAVIMLSVLSAPRRALPAGLDCQPSDVAERKMNQPIDARCSLSRSGGEQVSEVIASLERDQVVRPMHTIRLFRGRSE